MRIVSLLPSATEIICILGLEESLVGVTHECDYPEFVRSLPKVTRTLIPHDTSSQEIDSLVREQLQTKSALYSLDMPTLERLRPDLLVTQALCDVCAVSEEEVLAASCSLPGNPRVINLAPMSLEEVFKTMLYVGEVTGTGQKADSVVAGLQARVEAVEARSRQLAERPRVALLEWIDPPFTCGHWSPQLVEMAGGIEGLGKAGVPSRTMAWQEMLDWQPEVLFIACCGFSVERTLKDFPILTGYPGWNDLPCVQNKRVYITDGSAYFSRPGPRLVDSLEILAHALHPEIHPLPTGLPSPIQPLNT